MSLHEAVLKVVTSHVSLPQPEVELVSIFCRIFQSDAPPTKPQSFPVTHTHTHARIYAHTHKHARMYAHAHTHTHTHTHTNRT